MLACTVLISVLLSACAPSSLTTASAPQDNPALSFVVMGDNRPADPFHPEQPYIYHKIVRTAVSLKPELILNTGDLVVGYDATSPERASREFDDFERATKPIRDHDIPLYITMGNHSGYTPFARAEFSRRYRDKASGRLYYSIDRGNCHFIVLSSELEGEQAQISGAQLAWLKNDLEGAAGKHIFILLHRPLYPKIKHLDNCLNAHPEERDQLAQLLKQHQVEMVFVGHVHVYNYSVIDGLGQITAGGSGAPLSGTLAEGGFNHFFQVIVRGDDIDYRLLPVTNETLLATDLLERGYPEGALAMAEIAMETVPGHPQPYIIAALSHAVAAQEQQAAAMAGRLEEIFGNRDQTLFRLGEYALSVRQLELADRYLSQSMERDRNSFATVYHYGQLKQLQKQYPRALMAYDRALALTENPHYRSDINNKIREIKTEL